jgi:two-component system response regulator
MEDRDAMTNKAILLVEDNDDDVELTKRALERNRIANDLIVVNDGVAALEYLRAATSTGTGRPTLPALILLDLKLPRMDGLEVLQRLRADPKLRRQPVVILTSSKEEQDIVKSYDRGANSYIRKPVDFEQFSAAIKQLGLYWLVLNEAPPSPSDG